MSLIILFLSINFITKLHFPKSESIFEQILISCSQGIHTEQQKKPCFKEHVLKSDKRMIKIIE